MGVQSHVDQLLYDGETVLADSRGRKAGVVVTSHRLLVFTPETDGKNLHTLNRPNVTGLTKDERGEAGWLSPAAKWLGFGIVLTIVGALLDLDGVLGSVSTDGTTGAVGVGWIGDLFGLFNMAFGLLDDLLFFGGLLSVIAGIALLGWYWQSRSELLTVQIAGSDDLDVSAVGFGAESVRALQTAIDPRVADDSKPSNR
ncbi:hypothetical protein [Halodesulfurarchaeum sp.]|uniref:hypothetical protein n=1 Tax=Halodesulfurarchaeum sp. TaxID=1980530 RepID=UPI001BC4F038|nr:hypothetical protein [Halodesulfurarchaeum sp.]